MTDPFPPAGEGPWELRFTRRALADLGAASSREHPGDIQAVRRAATYPRVVDDFLQKRLDRPDAPGDPLHSVGRPDVISLHSAAGGRAATWYDPTTHVVWFLGFTPEHDYSRFEARAADGQLLPDEDDEVQLELEREQRDFESRVRPGISELVRRAIATPGAPHRGTVGGILELELSALVVRSPDAVLGDVWIVVHLPLKPTVADVPGWPGPDLLISLAAVVGDGDLDYPAELPTDGGWRPLDRATELGIVLRNVVLPTEP